ncbi:MAG: DNA mismatch repair protein MutS, partial [Deltaproteobacteria bacterium]|nr:DNA mismatch repair protein MutS [Deltaproteobacteria bacterium]
TSTYDGVSIAWAVTEYLHDAIGCRTLFATHYHELCALAETRERLRNLSVSVREAGGTIVFMRQVVEGGANRSYGIDVARLAGLPRTVVSRARQILTTLEADARLDHGKQLALFAGPTAAAEQTEPGAEDAVLERLRQVDPHRTTPLEALTLLAELREQLAH